METDIGVMWVPGIYPCIWIWSRPRLVAPRLWPRPLIGPHIDGFEDEDKLLVVHIYIYIVYIYICIYICNYRII